MKTKQREKARRKTAQTPGETCKQSYKPTARAPGSPVMRPGTSSLAAKQKKKMGMILAPRRLVFASGPRAPCAACKQPISSAATFLQCAELCVSKGFHTPLAVLPTCRYPFLIHGIIGILLRFIDQWWYSRILCPNWTWQRQRRGRR